MPASRGAQVNSDRDCRHGADNLHFLFRPGACAPLIEQLASNDHLAAIPTIWYDGYDS